jgi:hypothetical protein
MIREMPITTTRRYLSTPLEWLNFKNVIVLSIENDAEYIVDGNAT